MSLLRDGRAKDRTSLWCAALAVPAIISVGAAVWHGLRQGQDFQWSGAHMLGVHIDPYLQFLQHDPGHRILGSQVPNYLHELYVLLLPLGLLPFGIAKDIWVAINIGFSGACVWLLGRIYELTRIRVLLLALLFGMSTPFRITVNNGQNALLETLLLTLLLTAVARGGPVLGMSYFKYSFSPIFVCYLAMRRRWSWLVKSAAVPLLGLAIFWALVHGNLFREAMEPFAVSGNSGVAVGAGDLMSGDYYFRQRFAQNPTGRSGLSLAVVGSVVLGAVVALRRAKDRDAFPALICASLMLFVHLTYDYVALAIPVAALLSSATRETIPMRKSRRILAGASIGLLWYVLPSANRFGVAIWPGFLVYTSTGLLLVCFVCMLPRAVPSLAAEGVR